MKTLVSANNSIFNLDNIEVLNNSEMLNIRGGNADSEQKTKTKDEDVYDTREQ